MKKNNSINAIVSVVILLLFSACDGEKKGNIEQDNNGIPVETQKVAYEPLKNDAVFSGNIEGITTVKLGFMVSGKINLIAKRTGESVVKGQLLAALETTNYALNKQLADVQLKESNEEYLRVKLLHSRGSVSESEFSKMGSALEKVRLQQKLEVKNLADTRLHSPINGILLTKNAEIGEIISPGAPLFIVADIKKVSIQAFVPEAELHGIHIGQPAMVHIASLDKNFKGRVEELGAQADAASRAFTMKVTVDNTDLKIRPGMVAEVKMNINKPVMGISLPAGCIINDPGNQNYVYVVGTDGKKAYKRKISLGKMISNNIEVKSGLSAGEQVVISGQNKLSDGVLITVKK